MISCQQCRDDLAEYDLGGADAAQAEQIGAHLAVCPACRLELDEVRTAWAAVPQTLEPIEPSRELFDKVMARIGAGDAVGLSHEVSPWERTLSYLAAAAVFIALSLGLWRLSQPDDDAALRLSAEKLAERLGKLQQMERLLATDDVRFVAIGEGSANSDVEGFILWDTAGGQWHFYADHLPAQAAGNAYQIWVVSEDGRVLAGPALTRNAEGLGSAVVDLRDMDMPKPAKVIITREPATGSEQPTGEVILETDL